MSNNALHIVVPTGAVNDICLTQNVLTNGFLVLNGVDFGNFLDTGNYMRNISITSSNDLSGMFFTVIGVQNKQAITEVITGPAIGTVYSSNYYDSITSIQASAAALDVEVGSGNLTRVFYNAGTYFSTMGFSDPYLALTIDNSSGVSSSTSTQVDGIVYYANNLIDWTPSDTIYGTRSIKASDTVAQYQLLKADLQLYQAIVVSVDGFPTDGVIINILQP
jgi:hypothetical protein